MTREASTLLFIDFQAKLMPAIEDAPSVIANAARLAKAAELLDVAVLVTEQNPKGLGTTVSELACKGASVIEKMTFSAYRQPRFLSHLDERRAVIVTGCEAHICVLQTVLDLLESGRKVLVVRDAIGSRRAESKETAVQRMARHGAEIVTTEMVVFEWLQTAEHPNFREIAKLVK